MHPLMHASPPHAQVLAVRTLLRGRGLGGVSVGTVDDFQGQEARIVFISTVLSRPESLPRRLGMGGVYSEGAEGDGGPGGLLLSASLRVPPLHAAMMVALGSSGARLCGP